jgi:glutamate racemase
MSDAPVGVFDSGVGGLTVLRALTNDLPHENFLYLGDTARLPYGTKSADTVIRYARQATDALARFGVKCIVIACNTASAAALHEIRDHTRGVPVIGVIEPGAAAACATSVSGHIAVIATESTVQGAAYQHAIHRIRPDAQVISRAAQLFVALAEEGLHEGPIAESIARHYLLPILEHAPDTLVLGCTHFPMLIRAIQSAISDKVRIVDSAVTTAHAVRDALNSSGLARSPGQSAGTTRFLATDSPDRFARVGSRFLGRTLTPNEIELVDL